MQRLLIRENEPGTGNKAYCSVRKHNDLRKEDDKDTKISIQSVDKRKGRVNTRKKDENEEKGGEAFKRGRVAEESL